MFQPLWGKMRAERGECRSISPSRSRPLCRKTKFTTDAAGQEDAISRRGRLLPGTSRPTLVDGHPGPGSLLVVHHLENFVDMTHSPGTTAHCTRLFVDKSRYTSSDLQPWAVDVAQIINKIRHNLNEGKSTNPSTRRRPSSDTSSSRQEQQYQCWAGRLSEAWWLKH